MEGRQRCDFGEDLCGGDEGKGLESGDAAKLEGGFAGVVSFLDNGAGDLECLLIDEAEVAAGELAFTDFHSRSFEVGEFFFADFDGDDWVVPTGFGVGIGDEVLDRFSGEEWEVGGDEQEVGGGDEAGADGE